MYDNDPRVRRAGRGYTVTDAGTNYRILPTDVLGWAVYTGPNLDLVPQAGRGYATGYRSADSAIYALIGPPR